MHPTGMKPIVSISRKKDVALYEKKLQRSRLRFRLGSSRAEAVLCFLSSTKSRTVGTHPALVHQRVQACMNVVEMKAPAGKLDGEWLIAKE